ncbi:MAG: glutamate--tRNA ligase [candidate division Zixibacteria bacterium]|nr:glutamate--tRNA ligase [candidate division Zixibacteria bacterium]
MTSPVRVRIAPSPSGHLHVGTARIGICNWLFARHNGGKFILRIEDTDPERSFAEMVTSIQESMKWLGLNWDEGPYFQSQRGEIYTQWTERLRNSGHAYLCYCTPEELAAKREKAQQEKQPIRYDGNCRNLSDADRARYEAEGRKPALRLRIPEGETHYTDLVYGALTRSNVELDDFVCARADGRPTYNFACVIDDHDMQISHVIRGNDHITNTFKQVLIYRALGVEPPLFAHLPLNLGKDRRKISKREGATSVIEYQQMGFLPEAIVNFLALLGWSPGDEREIMTRDELVEAFTLERVNPSNPVFDMQKLEWMNGEYIRKMNTNELLERLTPVLMESGLVTRLHIQTNWAWMLRVVETLRERIRLLNDIVEQGAFYFTDKFSYEEKGAKKYFNRPGAPEDLTLLSTEFGKLPAADFTKTGTEAVLRKLAEQLGRSPAELIHPLRLALTGMTTGPGVFDIVELLGRDKCVERLKQAVEFIRKAGVANPGT